MSSLYNQFSYLLDNTAKRKIPFLFAIFILNSILDVLGVGLIGLFLVVMTNPEKYFNKVQQFDAFHIVNNQQNLLIIIGISILLALFLKGIMAVWIQKNTINFCQSLYVRLAARMLKAYQDAPYVFHLQYNTMYALTRLSQLNAFTNGMLLPSIQFVSSAFVGIAIFSLLCFSHPVATIVLLAIFILISLLQDVFTKKKMMQASVALASLSGEGNKSLQHALSGLKEVRVLGKEKYFSNKYIYYSQKISDAMALVTMFQSIPRYLVENGIACFIITLSLSGVLLGFSSGEIVSIVGMFTAAGARLLPIVSQLICSKNGIRSSYYVVKLAYEELVKLDHLSAQRGGGLETNESATSTLAFNYSLELKNVYFSYPLAKIKALNNISLKINKGQSVGIIGPSGAGKSTLINILLGLLSPDEGTILIDNEPLKNAHIWLGKAAYIPQSIFLLDDTMRRNIAMGVDDSDIDEDKLVQTVELAKLTEVIDKLPEGLDTVIGENGVRLSGGQRQRVALARALYHEREIIFLDEATSSLDNETEKEVINSIKLLKGLKTLVVIAHRLTTVEHCDIIYKVQDGSIVQSGTFAEVTGTVS